MTDVCAPAGRYQVAIAELPLSTRAVDRARGAIVVVPGAVGWVDAALAAASAGAIAVVVARPAFAPAAEVRRLAREAGVPVVAERALLRPDSAGDAAAGRSTAAGWSAPRIVVADSTAPPELESVVAREAVGWLRILAGDELTFVAGDGELALLETRGGIAATLSVVVTGRPGDGWIRAHALGEVISEIEVEDGRTRAFVATARGRASAPDRFESSARLAVGRAIAAVDSGEPLDDLRALAADTALVERMLPSAP